MNIKHYLNALLSSFGVHIVIAIVLVMSFEITPPEQPKISNEPSEIEVKQNKQRDIVKAVSVNKAELEKQLQRIEKKQADKRKAEEKRVKELERRARNAENKLDKNKKNLKEIDKRKKKAEQEAKKAKAQQIKEAKRAKELKKQVEKQEAAKKKAEQDAKKAKAQALAEQKKAEALKKKAEQEAADRKRKAQEAREKAELERQMAEQLAAEQALRKKAKRKQVLTELEKYNALIRNTIQQHLRIDETFKNKSCKLNIKLASSGFVTAVRTLSGDDRLCKEAERAVLKAEQLPVSKDPDVFAELKDINLTVEPEL